MTDEPKKERRLGSSPLPSVVFSISKKVTDLRFWPKTHRHHIFFWPRKPMAHGIFQALKTTVLLTGGLCSKLFGIGLMGYLAFQSMQAMEPRVGGGVEHTRVSWDFMSLGYLLYTCKLSKFQSPAWDGASLLLYKLFQYMRSDMKKTDALPMFPNECLQANVSRSRQEQVQGRQSSWKLCKLFLNGCIVLCVWLSLPGQYAYNSYGRRQAAA